MTTVSLTLPSDGDTIDAADVNTPFNTIANAINGNLDSTNVSAGGLTPANLTSGTGTSWAMQSYSPTLTNITIGNGTTSFKYIQIGKTVVVRYNITLGSTSSVGTDVSFTLPVTSVNYGTADVSLLAMTSILDANVPRGYPMPLVWSSTTSVKIKTAAADLTYLYWINTTATVPITFTTSDEFNGTFTYEAA